MTEVESTDGSRPKLFAVYLGGRSPKCNTELHDVVFTVGSRIEDTYLRLVELWFGSPERVHIDSWIELSAVDGYRVSLGADAAATEWKLYFINLGAYADGEFTELHANAFFVARSEDEVKKRAKSELLAGKIAVHTDDLFDIDDCLEVTCVDGYHVGLAPTAEPSTLTPNNGYHIIPKSVIAEYVAKMASHDHS